MELNRLLADFLALTPEVPESERRAIAWANASLVPADPTGIWRTDRDGRLITWNEYGKNSQHGWHIDHVMPQALGGRSTQDNLVARHWLGNTSAGGQLGAGLNAMMRGALTP